MLISFSHYSSISLPFTLHDNSYLHQLPFCVQYTIYLTDSPIIFDRPFCIKQVNIKAFCGSFQLLSIEVAI